MKNPLLLLAFVVVFLNSCSGSESDEGVNVVTYVKVAPNDNSILIGNSTMLKVTDNLSNDVTEVSDFYVDGVLNEDGKVFNPTKIGEYVITAKYNEFSSKPVKVKVIAATGVNFVHRILFEDFTGTWCGNCPIASARYDKLIEQNNRVVFLGVHGPEGTDDPYINSASQGLIDNLGVWGYPTIKINHTKEWNTANNNYTDVSFPIQYIKPFSKIGIAINTTLSGNVASGEFNLTFAEDFSDLKTIVYIVEDKLKYPQHNYFNGSGGKPILYGGVPIITDYIHHNVLRAFATSIGGDAIPSSNSTNTSLYSKNISYTIPGNFSKENMKIIVAVLNKNNEVLNVREATLGTSNALETL